MALLCYNKGCGQKFDPNKNGDDSCLFHPGVPIFHDALKGWSCCKKRTTDFSEFLSIKGCTRGPHSEVKPEEPLRPEVSSDKSSARPDGCSREQEQIYRGPKSAETLQRERPSKDEPLTELPHKVSPSLTQLLEKLDISKKVETEKRESQMVIVGTRCKNTGCKTAYEGPETDAEVCVHHPGAPVFHEGYKYWSCCCIKTTDFNAFLEQKGCSSDTHRWVPKQDKKKVACRHDWHQTGNNVVVTIYAKNANPELSSIKANQTVLSCQIHFENNKLFKRDFHLWGVIEVKQSSVNMVPSKVEVTLRKADSVSWGKLEDPNHKPEPEPVQKTLAELGWDIEDDDISDSDEEWAYDTPENRDMEEQRKERQKKAEEQMKVKREEVEQEMKRAMEVRRQKEEQKKKQQEEEEEEQEGFEDMPPLEDEDD